MRAQVIKALVCILRHTAKSNLTRTMRAIGPPCHRQSRSLPPVQSLRKCPCFLLDITKTCTIQATAGRRSHTNERSIQMMHVFSIAVCSERPHLP